MKKVSLFMLAAIVAASSMLFVSCGGDEEFDLPTITVNLNGTDRLEISVPADEEVTMKVTWEASGELEEVILRVVNGSSVVDLKSGFETKTLHRYNQSGDLKIASPDPVNGGEILYNASLKAKKGDVLDLNRQIKITFTAVAPPTNPLTEEDVAFTWSRTGNSAATGLDKFGLDWHSSTGTPLTANIAAKTGTEWYEFPNTVYAAVDTKEALKALFTEERKKTGDFTGVTVNNPSTTFNLVIGTKTGENYHLIHITGSTNAEVGGNWVRTITGKSKH